MLLTDVVSTSAEVAATRSRTAKIGALAATLRRAEPAEVAVVTAYLSGVLRQRRTGVGWRSATSAEPPAEQPSLEVAEVDALFEELSTLSGAGSQRRRAELLGALMRRATAAEQRYLAGLITGETRQGALDGVMLEAIAKASGLPSAVIRRAAMFAGDSGLVAGAALGSDPGSVASFGLQVGRPVRPMLASSAASVTEAMAKLGGPVGLEAKLDGIRVQVHRNGDQVQVFTRSLDEITDRVPEVVAAVAGLPVSSIVLDGEALALDHSGRPRPFQVTAARAMSLAAASQQEAVPLSTVFFDLLAVDGVDLVDEPATVRLARLAEVVPSELQVRRLVTADPREAESFMSDVLAAGHEGVVVKTLESTYEAGRRGTGWVKVKPVHTLDLVVLAVEWGSGRRTGTLSNIHLGARDPQTGGFVMLGKTFKGMTDEMLAWQTQRFLELETARDDWTVRLRPEQVVEIAFDGVQRSSRYPGGVALRFARVLRYRDDKSAAEADTLETVRQFGAREA
ncbi:MAG: ATP-dependent DNA ligase [Micropruina sp.]|nr:ATP-dependent DNA ligase [Micropruina sp.]